jgi:hypothetical protein
MFPQGGIMPILPAFGFKPNTQVSSSELEKKILAAVDTKLASNPQSQNITKKQIQEMINNTMTQMKDQHTRIINDTLSKSQENINKQIDLKIEHKLSNVTEKEFDEFKKQLKQQLNQINIKLSLKYTEKINNIKQELKLSNETSITKLQDEITILTHRIGLYEDSYATLTDSNKTLNEHIEEQTQNILILTTRMDSQEHLSTKFRKDLEEVKMDITRLDITTVLIYINLLNKINTLTFTGNNAVDQINQIVSVLTREQDELKRNYSQLDSAVKKNTNLINNKIEQLKTNLDNKITQIETDVKQINEALAEQNNKFGHFTTQFTQQLDEFKKFKQKTIPDQILKMDESIKNLNKNLDDFITQNNEQHQKIQTELGGKLNETAIQIQTEHDRQLQQMKDTLSNHVTDSIIDIKKQIEKNTAINQDTARELLKLDNFITYTVITEIFNNKNANKENYENLIQLISHNKEFLEQKLSNLSENQEKIQTIINNIIPENEITKLKQGGVSLFERIITFEQKMEKWSNSNQILLRKSLMKALGKKSQKIHLALDQLQKQIIQNDKQNKIALDGDKFILQQYKETLKTHEKTLKTHGSALEHEKQQRQLDTQKLTDRLKEQYTQNQQDKKQQAHSLARQGAEVSTQQNFIKRLAKKIHNHGTILTQNQDAIKKNKVNLTKYKEQCNKSLEHIQLNLKKNLKSQYSGIMNEVREIEERVLQNKKKGIEDDSYLYSRILQNNSNITLLQSMADNIENQLTKDDVTLTNIILLIKKITLADRFGIHIFQKDIQEEGNQTKKFKPSNNTDDWDVDNMDDSTGDDDFSTNNNTGDWDVGNMDELTWEDDFNKKISRHVGIFNK